MAMKRFFIEYWWTFPIMLALSMLALIVLFTKTPSILETIIGILLLLVIIALLISWVLLLINKQWLKFLLSFTVSFVVGCILLIPLTLSAMSGPDGFGKDHPIPEGLEYNLPLPFESEKVEPVDSLNNQTYLQIWNDIQGGLYKYDFYYGSLGRGEIFLRCYEVTSNMALSEDRLIEESRVKVSPQNQFGQVVNKQSFTIYEGDWDDYYAARIEVWFKNAETNQESKLLEKVYRVEGWMR
jgi:hypothetical protein